MEETFYSDSRSVNKSQLISSKRIGNENYLVEKCRIIGFNNLREQMQIENPSANTFKQNALIRADSIYSSYNVPIIKEQKLHRIRPFSMKQPRRLQQKVDEKFIQINNEPKQTPNPNLPTVWNINSNNCQVQMPFKNFRIPSEGSLTVQENMISTGFSKVNQTNDYDSFKDKIFKNTPNGAQDLTKPVLSLRKEANDEYNQSIQSSMIQYYNKMVSQKESAERKKYKKPKNLKSLITKNRINTAMPASQNSISIASNQRVMTKEGKRRRIMPESTKATNDMQNQNKSSIRDQESSERPLQLMKIDEKQPSLRVRRKKISSGSSILKRSQVSNTDQVTEKSEVIYKSDKIKLPAKKHKLNSSKASQLVNKSLPHSKVSEVRNKSSNVDSKMPMSNETAGIFGVNIDEASLQDAKELGFSFQGSRSNLSCEEMPKLKHKVEIIDWAKSKLFQMVLDKDIELNKIRDKRFFYLEEIDYIIDMMRNRYKDFKSNEMLLPFFQKGKNTLKLLLESLEVESLYDKIQSEYTEITLENCFKILIRCKMCFEARMQLANILGDIAAHDILIKDVFTKIEEHLDSSTDEEQRDELRRKGETLSYYAKNIVLNIRKLQKDHKLFGTNFVFANRKIDANIRREVGELRRLLEIYNLKISEDEPKELWPRPDISLYRERQ